MLPQPHLLLRCGCYGSTDRSVHWEVVSTLPGLGLKCSKFSVKVEQTLTPPHLLHSVPSSSRGACPLSLFYLLLAATLTLLACLIWATLEPPCHRSNKMPRSFHLMLTYVNGPPPTWRTLRDSCRQGFVKALSFSLAEWLISLACDFYNLLFAVSAQAHLRHQRSDYRI